MNMGEFTCVNCGNPTDFRNMVCQNCIDEKTKQTHLNMINNHIINSKLELNEALRSIDMDRTFLKSIDKQTLDNLEKEINKIVSEIETIESAFIITKEIKTTYTDP